MPPWNMAFTLFLLDPRPIDQWLPALDEAFGGRFIQDAEFKAEGSLRYTSYVFGLTIDCFGDATWEEGRVYRFVGGTESAFRFDTSDEMDVGFHVRALLTNVGLHRIMNFDEYVEEKQRQRRRADQRRDD